MLISLSQNSIGHTNLSLSRKSAVHWSYTCFSLFQRMAELVKQYESVCSTRCQCYTPFTFVNNEASVVRLLFNCKKRSLHSYLLTNWFYNTDNRCRFYKTLLHFFVKKVRSFFKCKGQILLSFLSRQLFKHFVTLTIVEMIYKNIPMLSKIQRKTVKGLESSYKFVN